MAIIGTPSTAGRRRVSAPPTCDNRPVSAVRRQTFIAAPPRVVWDLIADVDRHPEWWPGVAEVHCEELARGCTYREVIRTPFGKAERNFLIEDLDDPSRFRINCVDTGAFLDLTLTEAQGGCFVEASAGMEPRTLGMRAFDTLAGPRYWRTWLDRSLDAMNRVACERAGAPNPG